MRQLVSWLVVLGVGCSSVPAATPQSFRPSDVSELGALPPGYDAGDVVRASCSRVTGEAAFENEPLGAMNCSFARLSRLLRAKAGEQSAKVIIGKRCRERGGAHAHLECTATLAWAGPHVALAAGSNEPSAGPAPSAEQVLDLDDPRPQDQDQIRVAFVPSPERGARAFAGRDYAAVDETHWPSVGRRTLGQVSARCDACEPNTLRYALRVTAGHVGAGEVTAVKCFQDAGGLSCVATALAPWSS